jgi:hypothetical protein
LMRKISENICRRRYKKLKESETKAIIGDR